MAQVVFIVAANACAMLAMPFFYRHRTDGSALAVGIVAFVVLPLIAGIMQKRAHRSILLIAMILLILCPVVYAVTDPMAVEFEKWRDAFFLATLSTIVFVAAVGLASSVKSERWAIAVTAALGLVFSAVGIFILLVLVVYLE